MNPQYLKLQALFNLCDRERHQLAERNRQLEAEIERLQRIIDDVAPCGRG